MADNDHHRRDEKHKHKHKHKRKHKSGGYESDDSHDKRRRKYETETAEEYRPKNIKRDRHYDCGDDRDYDNKHYNRSGGDEAELQDSEEIPDYDFDWEQHRYTLNQIFFTDDDYVKRYSLQFLLTEEMLKSNSNSRTSLPMYVLFGISQIFTGLGGGGHTE